MAIDKVATKTGDKTAVRLYSKGVHLGFRRSHRAQKPHTSLIKIEGVNDPKDALFYLGKRVAFVYRGTNPKLGKVRVNWGRVTTTHGNSGVVRAKFSHNLPPSSFGSRVRVFLYPSRV